MVEGHSVHRVASFHRDRLVGKKFQATSPNGRFTEGAKAINGKVFCRIEAVGKNLFAFFGEKGEDLVVVHVHFGMAGNWAVFQDEEVPEPSKTNRLRLVHNATKITADLSAMSVNLGGMDMYHNKKAKLGHDPLRQDADPDALWSKVKSSKKSIGALIMDQSYFTGPGNIYRAEILFKAGIHPDIPGRELERNEFDLIWKHTVDLLQRGYETGSILTVDPDEAVQLGNPRMRRYIYNTAHCPRCATSIKTWDIQNRKCYACPTCQPRRTSGSKSAVVPVTPESNHVPFNSHCARESAAKRLAESGPRRLTVKEIKRELDGLDIEYSSNVKKAALVALLESAHTAKSESPGIVKSSSTATKRILSSEDAALEKASANESLAVEHIAELAPVQARRARLRAKREASSTPAFVTPTKKLRSYMHE